MLVDADWQGQPRKLLLHANRNGFFYVLDRTNGALLLAKPFVKKLTWASEIGPDGRPVLNPGQEPTPEGTHGLPGGGRRHQLVLHVLQPGDGPLLRADAREVQRLHEGRPASGRPASPTTAARREGGAGRPGQKILRAIDIQTGAIAWELPQTGPARSWGGTLATASGLVFFGEDSGALMAVDASTGKPLWHFQTNALWKASPMTYMFDGKQHIAVASGPNILSFALVE